MKVRDFRWVRRDGVEWYEFHFGGSADFAEVLERFKALVPLAERQYAAADDHRWGVKVAYASQPKVAAALGAIFENWANCVEMISRQMSLPGFA